MSIRSRLYQLGGLARTAEVMALGYRRHDIDLALARGRILRPSRGWLAHPSADPLLLLAARQNVVLSCVTQAQRLGLWVRDSPSCPHVAVPNPNSRSPKGNQVVHWLKPWVPRVPFSLVDPIENVLQCVVACQPHESALVIWESAMNKQIINYQSLEALPLTSAARELLKKCTPFSDSGLETLVVDRLRWLPVKVRQQVHVRGRRVDLLIGARLVVQIDGATHTGEQRDSDNLHDAELMRMGYRVIRVSYRQVLHQWELVQELILAAIARDEHVSGVS